MMCYQFQCSSTRPGLAKFIRATILASLPVLAACGGGGGGGAFNNVIAGATSPPPSAPAAPANLSCDENLKTAFRPDSATSVLLVKQFKAGEPLLLTGTATASTPKAGADTRVVKLLVGPGNPGPAGAPSTTAGIGIEVWLPNASAWNERIRVYGNGGFAGSDETNLAKLGNGGSGSPIPVRTRLFCEPVQFGRVGNRRDPRFFREQPRERELCRRHLLRAAMPASTSTSV